MVGAGVGARMDGDGVTGLGVAARTGREGNDADGHGGKAGDCHKFDLAVVCIQAVYYCTTQVQNSTELQ